MALVPQLYGKILDVNAVPEGESMNGYYARKLRLEVERSKYSPVARSGQTVIVYLTKLDSINLAPGQRVDMAAFPLAIATDRTSPTWEAEGIRIVSDETAAPRPPEGT